MKLFRSCSPSNISRSGAKRRAGLSLLEFVGCTIALVGGAWLGAIYLGINVQHLGYTALEEADLLEKVPEKWRPAAPDGNERLQGKSHEELVSSLRKELVALRSEISTLKTADAATSSTPTDIQTVATVPGESSDAGGPTLEKSLGYWNRLSDIALGEAALQRDADQALTDENAAKVLVIKSRISRFAATAVEVIPREQVDTPAVQLGKELGTWYDRGGDLYDEAARIQSFPSDNTNRNRLTQDWRREDAQHRNEGQVLSNRAIAVRDEMQRHFGTEFPAFGQPSTKSDSEMESQNTAG
jgi:hypothetical protein